MKRARYWLLAVPLFAHAAYAFEQCGSLANAYGPYDYWVDKDRTPIVIGAHFTPEVEALIRGATGSMGADIDYTLRAIPNHPRALMSMMRYAERTKMERPPGAKYSIECYFDRAMRFRPKDGTVRMVYASFLTKKGKNAEALDQLNQAKELSGENANLLYNIGLTYFELGDYEKSLANAHKAYAMGFDLPGLKNKLQRVGKWREPEKLAPKPDEGAAGTAPESGDAAANPRVPAAPIEAPAAGPNTLQK